MTYKTIFINCHQRMSRGGEGGEKSATVRWFGEAILLWCHLLTDQVVDWGVCWHLRERRQQLMRFNWSVSCQLSLVPHLTLSDAVSLLHLQGHECVWVCVCMCVCMWGRERALQRDITYRCVYVEQVMYVPVREKERVGVYECVDSVIESKCYLGSPRVWWFLCDQ